MTEFERIHNTLARMQGYEPMAWISLGEYYDVMAANGLSAECRANQHGDCVDAGCVCACHAGEDE